MLLIEEKGMWDLRWFNQWRTTVLVSLVLMAAIGLTVQASDTANPDSVTLAGSLQAALGCPGDWQPECESTRLTYDVNSDIWMGSFDLPAGSYEYKAALNGTWDENYGLNAEAGGANIPLVLDADTTVQFFYDHKTHWIADDVNAVIATAIGSFQTALGCSANDDPTCMRAWLQDQDGNGLYSFSSTSLPVGEYTALVSLDRGAGPTYGRRGEEGGAPVDFTVDQAGFAVTIGYSPSRNLVNARVVDPNAVEPTAVPTPMVAFTGSVVAPGNYQSEAGCEDTSGNGGDWEPACAVTQLTDPDGDGIYTLVIGSIPAGNYEYKIAIDGTWATNYGADGAANGPNIPFEVPVDFAQVTINWDSVTKIAVLTIDESVIGAPAGPAGAAPIVIVPPVEQPDSVVIPGSLQSAAGCPGDWQPDCANTALTFDEADQVWTGSVDLPAGNYEYKVAINGTWDENYGGNADAGGANVPLNLDADATVRFYYDHRTKWVADSVGDVIATAPGSYQAAIGCPGDWQPDCLRSWLQDPDGDGLYVMTTDAIPAGDYEVKVAINESWDVNYGLDGEAGGANIPFNVPANGTLVAFVYNASSNVLLIGVGTMPMTGPVAKTPDLSRQRAHWVSADTLAWEVGDPPEGATFKLFYSPDGNMVGDAAGFSNSSAIDLTLNPDGLSDTILERFPHLAGYTALQIAEADLEKVPGIVRTQAGVVVFDAEGQALDGTGLQIPGVLDDLFRYDGPLGLTFEEGVPTIRVWAPTAQRIRLNLFDDADPNSEAERLDMAFDRATGVWSVTGTPDWYGKYYTFQVRVYSPTAGEIVTNNVTDPYSVSLSMNSTRSQIIDLADPALLPEGWSDLVKPTLEAPEDIVVYEMHVRDFSMFDQTVPEAYRGTFMAFTEAGSNGMQHLAGLAEAGLTHLHLLPTMDCATINEDPAMRQEVDFAQLATFPPDSEEQQALINAIRDQDGFNWCYDPFHFNVPEGSYSTDPNSAARIVEFRRMVQALNEAGLRVVIDVVYNHTNSAGQGEKSVFDRIVPGYYHRLNATGVVETSTCCANTASEHYMMGRFIVDSVRLWATQYKVDAFRFDLMGHHMRYNMEEVRAALDSLTLEADGVDGRAIYVYGEGWNFGEVQDNARGVNATQQNMGGVGIGTFNDRLRDAVRGGSPFGDREFQGFISGLSLYDNGLTGGTPEEQAARMLLFMDQIRIGLAGNLRDYIFMGAAGEMVSGADVLYNGSPTGYTLDPQEQIVYISKHDNETIWDILMYKQLPGATVDDYLRINNLGTSIVMMSQGVPFFHAGDDMLRSKSMDRNSYNSGDWFNRLDFTYQFNNFGIGLPLAGDNQDRWPVIQPILANPDLRPGETQIQAAMSHFREMLQVRQSSRLFRLRTADEVQQHLSFQNVGPDQTPGLIVMTIADTGEADLDPAYEMAVVLFNASPEAITFTQADLVGMGLELHPVLAASADVIVQAAAFDSATGIFTVPGRTAAVFMLAE
jgi:pullulanase-type alpha-1,6-glucosidase